LACPRVLTGCYHYYAIYWQQAFQIGISKSHIRGKSVQLHKNEAFQQTRPSKDREIRPLSKSRSFGKMTQIQIHFIVRSILFLERPQRAKNKPESHGNPVIHQPPGRRKKHHADRASPNKYLPQETIEPIRFSACR
jgi:hypothetical protein